MLNQSLCSRRREFFRLVAVSVVTVLSYKTHMRPRCLYRILIALWPGEESENSLWKSRVVMMSTLSSMLAEITIYGSLSRWHHRLSKLIIGLDNGLSPVRRQAIIQTYDNFYHLSCRQWQQSWPRDDCQVSVISMAWCLIVELCVSGRPTMCVCVCVCVCVWGGGGGGGGGGGRKSERTVFTRTLHISLHLKVLNENFAMIFSQVSLSFGDPVSPLLTGGCQSYGRNLAKSRAIPLLTHWGWDRMAIILPLTTSNIVSWMKMFEFL